MIVLLLPEYVITYVLNPIHNFTPTEVPWPFLISQIFASVSLVAGLVALFWVGLWQGFKARSQAGAVITTVILARGGSSLAYLIWSFPHVQFFVRPILYLFRGAGSTIGYSGPMPHLINLLLFHLADSLGQAQVAQRFGRGRFRLRSVLGWFFLQPFCRHPRVARQVLPAGRRQPSL